MNDIQTFENEFMKIKRAGSDKLLDYIKKSDFYQAPSSTKYHLSCPGGLLRHSLNVLNALRGLLFLNEDGSYSYLAAGKEVSRVSEETVIIISLLHDLCKTHFYDVEMRNKKENGVWKEVATYTINDEFPYGHGEKSVFMIESMMRLSMEERMAIRWHMGFPDDYAGKNTFGFAVEKWPIIWALVTADLQASRFMESETGNKTGF